MAAYIKLRVQTDGVDTAVLGVQRLAGSVLKLSAAAAGLATAGLSLKSIFDQFAKVIQMGSNLHDLSIQTGIATDKLAVMQEMFRAIGKSGEDVGGVINKMQRTIAEAAEGGESAAKAFAKVGLNVQELINMRGDQQFDAISKAIQAIENPTLRTNAAMDIFKKSGAELIRIFSDRSAWGAAVERVGKMAALWKRNAAAIDELGDTLAAVGLKVSGFFLGFIDRVLPQLEEGLKSLNKIDFTVLGQEFGKWPAMAIEAWKQGKFSQFLSDSITIAFDEGMNGGFKAMQIIIKSPQVKTFSENLGRQIGIFATDAFIGIWKTAFERLMTGLANFYGLIGMSWLEKQTKEVALPQTMAMFDKISEVIKAMIGVAPEFQSVAGAKEARERVAALEAAITPAESGAVGRGGFLGKKGGVLGVGGGEPTGTTGPSTGVMETVVVYEKYLDRAAGKLKELADVERQLQMVQSDRYLTGAEMYTATAQNLKEQAKLLEGIIDLRNQEIERLNALYFAESTTAEEREEIEKESERLLKERIASEEQLFEIGLARRRMEPDPSSLSATMYDTMFNLTQQIGTQQEIIARGFSSVVGGAIDGIAQGIQGLLTLTMSWGEALRKIGSSILNSVINAISRMFAEWIAGMALQAAMSVIFGKKKAVAEAPAALSTSIQSYGVAAIVGTAAMLAGLVAISGAFAKGGYTGAGDKNEVAGVVHKGEWVLTKEQVDAIGLNRLADAFPTSVAAPQKVMINPAAPDVSTQIKIAAFDDRVDARQWARTSDAEAWFVDMGRKTQHQWGPG